MSRRAELKSMLSLSLPVVMAELGWMGMGVVDTMMVGRVSAEAIGAVSLGRALFFTVSIVGIGLLLGLDTLVATAHGARRPEEGHRALLHGVLLAVALTLPLTLLIRAGALLFDDWGIEPAVLEITLPYTYAAGWSLLPLLLYTAFRRYLQAVNRVHAVMFALTTANLVNVFGNWALIFGKLGMPALGATGAGWATCISSAYMALVLFGAVLLHDREERGRLLRLRWSVDPQMIGRLLKLGAPAAGQLGVEVAVFATATALAGWLDRCRSASRRQRRCASARRWVAASRRRRRGRAGPRSSSGPGSCSLPRWCCWCCRVCWYALSARTRR
jgi:MATE family multidrug resistance protein